jgi:hypothetical protein
MPASAGIVHANTRSALDGIMRNNIWSINFSVATSPADFRARIQQTGPRRRPQWHVLPHRQPKWPRR